MAQLVVTVPDDQTENVQHWLHSQGLYFEVQPKEEIPEAHKRAIDAALAEYERDGVAYEAEEIIKELRSL